MFSLQLPKPSRNSNLNPGEILSEGRSGTSPTNGQGPSTGVAARPWRCGGGPEPRSRPLASGPIPGLVPPGWLLATSRQEHDPPAAPGLRAFAVPFGYMAAAPQYPSSHLALPSFSRPRGATIHMIVWVAGDVYNPNMACSSRVLNKPWLEKSTQLHLKSLLSDWPSIAKALTRPAAGADQAAAQRQGRRGGCRHVAFLVPRRPWRRGGRRRCRAAEPPLETPARAPACPPAAPVRRRTMQSSPISMLRSMCWLRRASRRRAVEPGRLMVATRRQLRSSMRMLRSRVAKAGSTLWARLGMGSGSAARRALTRSRAASPTRRVTCRAGLAAPRLERVDPAIDLLGLVDDGAVLWVKAALSK